MSHPLQLTQWNQELKGRFPELPKRVIFVLALYSFGLLLAKVSGLCSVAIFLSRLLGWPFLALRKRLSEFYKEAPAKSGAKHGCKRKDFDVTTCFAPLLRWILSLWSGRHLALAIDVTNLGDRFHVLCVSVVVNGIGIPVAWKVLLGGVKDPWNPHWQTLLQKLKTAVPADWTVIVLSDRGLESPDLFRFIVGLHWHPLMRVKKGGKFRPKGWGKFYCFGDLVRRVGSHFYAEGKAYSGEQMPCTLLACFNEGYDEPWFVLSDLPPEAGNAVWYAFRAWIEQGFKVIKGGGWDWEKTRMEDPARVERFWLVMAVATLWVVAIGIEDEARQRAEEEAKELARRLGESLEQAQARLEREQRRQEKLKEALQAREAKKQQRRAQQQQQRSEKKAKKKAGKARAAEQSAKVPLAQAKKTRPRTPVMKGEMKQRTLRVSIQGLAALSALWQKGQNRLPCHLHPQAWPQPCHPASSLSEDDFLSQQT